MATKKVATKKTAKPAKPVKKSPAKPAPAKAKVAKSAKPASKKVVKPAAKKAVPAKKATAKPSKAAPRKVVKKPVPQPQKKAAAKPVAKEPVKKPAVSAKTHPEVKPAIKPLEKHQVKKEPVKPTKIVIPKTSTDKKIKYEPDFTKSVLDTQKGQQNNGPSLRYSDAELIEFRELINKKLDTAKKELAYLQGLITRKDESGELDEGRYMTMEDGSMSMEREQLSQMASRQIQFIDHLEKAIMRIENKTYGICRVTGKLIDKARLRAVPHATLSIEAKQMMNK